MRDRELTSLLIATALSEHFILLFLFRSILGEVFLNEILNFELLFLVVLAVDFKRCRGSYIS